MLPFITEIQLSVGETEQVMKAGNTEYVLYHPCPHRLMLVFSSESSSFSNGHGD